MARKAVLANVGRRKIEVTNLDKVLFPADGITKAALMAYYLRIAPTLIMHLKGRPLTLVRYPDGIHGEQWFQKNRPDFTPEWIETIEHEKIKYLLCEENACLAWLANLASIEIHQMTVRRPELNRPDMIVFDLDPPEGEVFTRVVEVSLLLKERLERLGYQPFAKSSGRKGIHVAVPLIVADDIDTVFAAAQEIAKGFVEKHPKLLTMQMKKEARQGKLFVDIYRNRRSQTVVAAYSVRAADRAPVSMPLPWEEIESLKDPSIWNIETAPERVAAEGDAWAAFGAYAVRIHTVRAASVAVAGGAETEKLALYARKRQFDRTPEPAPLVPIITRGDAFVVHRHHASHLHYDLRLEMEGVLKSWAVPRGLPPRPGIKRLAVETEDHPLSYLTFEGKIPAGEYGAGTMWVFAQGRHEITKKKKDGYYFRLHSEALTADYRVFQTRGKECLLERLDAPQNDWLANPPLPMLAELGDKPFSSEDHLFEVKWDGIRALIIVEDGQISIRSRSGRDITALFPELQGASDSLRATCAIFDAEIVCLDEDGVPKFEKVIRRIHQASASSIERRRKKDPAVCYVFDCLYLDGRPIVHEPLTRRREWMEDAIRKGTVYRVSGAFDDGPALYEATAQHGLEGIIAKRRDSRYLPGQRSRDWLKIKVRQTEICVIVGYTQGKGNRESTFGALHLGRYGKGRLHYLGKVGTGLDDSRLKALGDELQRLKKVPPPFEKRVEDESHSTWVEPALVCQVSYLEVTSEGSLRHPVFLKLRPDLSPADCDDDARERKTARR
ncbi:MAG: non-homologous end-joining DNA ligase [Acidobacteriota bacterium]